MITHGLHGFGILIGRLGLLLSFSFETAIAFVSHRKWIAARGSFEALRLAAAVVAQFGQRKHLGLLSAEGANNLQQSGRFDGEPPKAVLGDFGPIDWIPGG